MTCIIEPANLASLRVATRLGFAERAHTAYHGVDILVLERGAG